MSKETYFNFPIVLLQDAFKDIRLVMDNIMHYAGYVHAYNLEFGEEEERMEAAGNFFNMIYRDNYSSYKKGEMLFNSIPSGQPMVGINKDVCLDYYETKKTNDEIAVLMAFLALKSIIGFKKYAKTDNIFLLTRMGGYAKKEDLPEILPESLGKYNHIGHRRKLDRIKKELQLKWNINIYSRYNRGFYVSIDSRCSKKELIEIAEQEKEENKWKRLKAEEEELRKKVIEEIKNRNDNVDKKRN